MSDQTTPQYPSYPTGGEQTPPPAYGTPPPAYGTPPLSYGGAPMGQTVPYASWGSRVGAVLLDGLIAVAISIVPFIIGGVILGSTATTTTDVNGFTTVEGGNPLGVVFLVLGYLAVFGFAIWNQVFRQGRKGQTVGKKIVGIQVVRADSGQFLGAGLAFVRMIMSSLLGACFLNYLWPLWDAKKQTWHDKVVGSVVIRK